jgi:hypothetical protein
MVLATIVSNILFCHSLYASSGDTSITTNKSSNSIQSMKKGIDVTYNSSVYQVKSYISDDNRAMVSLDSYIYDKIKVYNIPLSAYIKDNHIVSASVNYIDNSYKSSSGMGDTSVGYGYKSTILDSDVSSTSLISLGLPTGDFDDDLGSGSYSATFVQSFKTKLKNSNLKGASVYASFAYSTFSDSKKRISKDTNVPEVVKYSDRITATLGIEKEFDTILVNSKAIYYTSDTDKKEYQINSSEDEYDNGATFYDVDISLGYNLSNSLYLSAGFTLPILSKYSKSSLDNNKRESSYYISFVSKY